MSSLKYLVLVDPRHERGHRFPQSMADTTWEVEEGVLAVAPCTEEVLDITLSRAFGTDSSLENHFPETSRPISPEEGKGQYMSTEKENTAIASLVVEIDSETDSENLINNVMLIIFGTDVVDQSGSLPPISDESQLNFATLAADSGCSSESNFSRDSE